MKDEQDRFGVCPLHHPAFCGDLSRRGCLELVAVAGATLRVAGQAAAADQPAPPPAPPAKKPPVLKVAYVRHAAAVCGGWPGHGFMRLMDEGIVAGFHVLQIYGDHVRKLRDFCQLYRIEAVHSWDKRVSFDFEPDCT